MTDTATPRTFRSRVKVTLVICAFIIAALAGYGVIHYGWETHQVYRNLGKTFDSVKFPPSYVLISRSDQGSAFPFDDQDPSELRVFRVPNSKSNPEELAHRLGTQGFSISPLGECYFEARRGEESLAVGFDPRPQVTVSRHQGPVYETETGPACPEDTWTTTYANILLHLG